MFTVNLLELYWGDKLSSYENMMVLCASHLLIVKHEVLEGWQFTQYLTLWSEKSEGLYVLHVMLFDILYSYLIYYNPISTGRITIGLYGQVVPKTVGNVFSLLLEFLYVWQIAFVYWNDNIHSSLLDLLFSLQRTLGLCVQVLSRLVIIFAFS